MSEGGIEHDEIEAIAERLHALGISLNRNGAISDELASEVKEIENDLWDTIPSSVEVHAENSRSVRAETEHERGGR